MNESDRKVIHARSASEAAPGFKPEGEGAPAPLPDQAPLAYAQSLAGLGHLNDTLAFLVAALPRREAVWWVCRCLRSILPATLPDPALAALVAAENWTAAPGDVNRRKTFPLAEAAGYDHPCGAVAISVFLSGGSMIPAAYKEVQPADHVFGKMLTGALTLAAATTFPAVKIPVTNLKFFEIGLAVARGEDRWKPSL